MVEATCIKLQHGVAGRLASRSVSVPFVAWQFTSHNVDNEHVGFDFVVG